ncbi:MAG: hypothetical protein E7812_13625 [Phenylobacterium sp.]|nr:MAG: hypothetical protein E7812_13625 [Phenylobacterium sp.]
MRRILFAAGLTLAVAASSAAEARSRCETAAHDRRAVGAASPSRTSCDRYATTPSDAAPAYAGDPRYAVNTSASCRKVTRSYHDQAGRRVYAQEQVCE